MGGVSAVGAWVARVPGVREFLGDAGKTFGVGGTGSQNFGAGRKKWRGLHGWRGSINCLYGSKSWLGSKKSQYSLRFVPFHDIVKCSLYAFAPYAYHYVYFI